MKIIRMIGSPIAHVRTPGILNGILAAEHVDARVITEEIGEADLATFLKTLALDIKTVGLLVTMPLKTALCPHLDGRSDVVDLTGSTNCVRIDKDRRLIGVTFDGFGLVSAIEQVFPNLPKANVMQVGCGGAGTAIAAALSSVGVKSLTINDLARERVGAFAEKLRRRLKANVILDDETRRGFDVVINSSPIGMNDGDPSPIPDSVTDAASVVVDITSEPRQTALMTRAIKGGKIFVGGTAMVGGQVRLIKDYLFGDFSSELEVIAARRSGGAR